MVNEVIGTLIKKKLNSLLSYGYKPISGKSGQGVITDFESVYPNSLVSILNNSHFMMLSGYIGETAFKFLLLNTSLFLQIENGCYIQLCGAPLNSLKSKHKPAGGLGRMRQNLDKTVIQWPRFLYGKPVYNQKGKISASLMPTR